MTSATLSAAAAKQILGFYDTIPAMDPKAFAAGLVEILSSYPPPVVERAASPSRGLAAVVAYPNLAKFKQHLDGWLDEHMADVQRIERANRKRLPEPAHNPEMEARVAKGMHELAEQLKRGIGPSTA